MFYHRWLQQICWSDWRHYRCWGLCQCQKKYKALQEQCWYKDATPFIRTRWKRHWLVVYCLRRLRKWFIKFSSATGDIIISWYPLLGHLSQWVPAGHLPSHNLTRAVTSQDLLSRPTGRLCCLPNRSEQWCLHHTKDQGVSEFQCNLMDNWDLQLHVFLEGYEYIAIQMTVTIFVYNYVLWNLWKVRYNS